jgi:CspA family cold shock protein
MAIGKVKFYNENKGFGFLIPEDGGKDVFVHANELKQSGMTSLFERQNVTDALSERNDKVIAINIRTVET